MENKQEEVIFTLAEILDKYLEGEIIPEKSARKCYMNEQHKAQKLVSWIHDRELKNQALLRAISKSSAKRDLLQNRSLL